MLINDITPEMEAATNAKFEAWDNVIKTNALESDNPIIVNNAYRLLKDPTIYMYAFFKDFKDVTQPLKLYPYQDIIINDTHSRVLFAAANQIGKSIELVCEGTDFALKNPGTTTVIVSKTLPQSKDLLRQIKQLLYNSTLEYKMDIGESETKTEIYFRHYDVDGKELPQSRIICVPATGAALGYAVDLLLLDELAFFDDGRYFYFQIAQPRTYATKGRIKAFSNPNGEQGVFWDLWNDSDFHKYNFNYLHKPGNTQAAYDRLRQTLTTEEFDSTVAAKFTSAQGAFLTLDERKRIQHLRPNYLPAIITNPIYIFFDFAKSQDRTVRVCGQEINGRVVVLEMKEYPQGTPYDEVLQDLQNLIIDVKSSNIHMVGWDNTGVGRGIEDFINRVQTLGIMCNPVEFSLENKSRIYVSFKFLVEKDMIDIPFVDECDKQLSLLRFQKSSRGYLQVHHASERDRDDFPDAIAGLCSLIIQPDNPPVTMVIV